MPLTVAMYEQSHAHIGPRLDALGLDIQVRTFGADGTFAVDGARVPPAELDVDYFWLSSHVNDGARAVAFETVLGCRSVNVLQTFNAGLDDPVYRKLAARGIRIVNSSAQGVAIAEYVMAQVLGLVHPVDLQREQQARKIWKITPFREISRSHWLIVGYGPIGQALAARVKPFGAAVSVVRRTPRPCDGIDRVGTTADLDRFLPDADVVVLACSLNDDTRGLAGADFFSRMKADALLVNVARGALVDEQALLAALDGPQLAGAVLDVFRTEPLPEDDPLWIHPKVRLTPHTSFAGDGSRGRWDRLFLDNIARFVNGEALVGEVDPKDIP